MKGATMELKIWPGDQDTPSIHLESLQILTYIKIAKVQAKVQASGNALWTPKGSLPVLTYKDKHYCSFPEVTALFSSIDMDPDQLFDDTVKSNIAAYTAMLKEKLYPAIQYTWWLDRKNFELVSRPTFAKASTWPLNFYYPAHFEHKASGVLEALFSSIHDLDSIAAEVYSDAQLCLNSLSTILGDKKYFFGNELTSFDATLYAYLCPTLYKDFPNKILESHIKGCSNLVKYIERITETLFPNTLKEGRTSSKQEPATHASNNQVMSKRTHIIVSVLIAATSLACFAYYEGVLDFGKGASEDDEGTDDTDRTGSFLKNLYE